MCLRAELNKVGQLLDSSLRRCEECIHFTETDCADVRDKQRRKQHLQEISNHITQIKYHIKQICDDDCLSQITHENKDCDTNENMLGTNSDTNIINEVLADDIYEKIKLVEKRMNFCDKRMRRMSSVKHLSQWEEILEDEWNVKNSNNEYDFSGVSIIGTVKDCKLSRLLPKSDVNLDNNKKCKSSDCILEQDDEYEEDAGIPQSVKKCSSMNNILNGMATQYGNDSDRSDLFGNDSNQYNSDYLLSMKDLEDIGKISEIGKQQQQMVETSKSCTVLCNNNNNHAETKFKPKVVGVLYKRKI